VEQPLETEINAQIIAKMAWKLILPGGAQLDPEAKRTGINVQVTSNFSKVTIITRLAPSPDWFIELTVLTCVTAGRGGKV